jgi:hypothetical protein
MTAPPTGARPEAAKGTAPWLTSLLLIAVAAAGSLAAILNAAPLQSANDRSRWCTVWSLVERGTYQIDEIIAQPGWDTIDKVYYRNHFYSSKPPLTATMVAGVYWALKHTLGLDLLVQPDETIHSILVLINWVPWIAALCLIAAMGQAYANREFTRMVLVVTSCFGTLLTTFLVTLNNHTPAAVSVVIALYALLRIEAQGHRNAWLFALAGFFGALAVCNELPACAFGAALFVLLARRAWRQTLLWFVPAAVVPLGVFFITNWLCTGGIMPFYASFGSATNDYYKYVIDGIPSYWMNPSPVDQPEPSALVYLWHCTFGHHGIYSLSPIFLLSAIGWMAPQSWKDSRLRIVNLLGLGLTLWVLGFYLARPASYNYGGNTSALRWALWLVPLWLLGMLPLLDVCSDRRGMRIAVVALLFASVFSATFPNLNPWQQPWLKNLHTSWFPAPLDEETSEAPRGIWLGQLPDTPADKSPVRARFESRSTDNTRTVLELEAVAAEIDDRAEVTARVRTLFETQSESEIQTELVMLLVRSAVAAGKPAADCLDAASKDSESQPEFVRFLYGLPRRPAFKERSIRYLKTPLRRDAFRCRIVAASVLHDGLRYRRDVWLCDEIPFGVAQIEDTIFDPADNSVVFRQRHTIISADGFTAAETNANK